MRIPEELSEGAQALAWWATILGFPIGILSLALVFWQMGQAKKAAREARSAAKDADSSAGAASAAAREALGKIKMFQGVVDLEHLCGRAKALIAELSQNGKRTKRTAARELMAAMSRYEGTNHGTEQAKTVRELRERVGEFVFDLAKDALGAARLAELELMLYAVHDELELMSGHSISRVKANQ
ncbi:MAG: hypothetical protein ACE37K_00745 [Planctomycetota bacterium]